MTMVTVTKFGSGALRGPNAGVGMKVFCGRVLFGPNSEAISAADMEMRTLFHIEVPGVSISALTDVKGTSIIGSVVAPGSPDNYASFRVANYATGAIGTGIPAGTVNVKVVAYGE
jgi:hypothetical protein